MKKIIVLSILSLGIIYSNSLYAEKVTYGGEALKHGTTEIEKVMFKDTMKSKVSEKRNTKSQINSATGTTVKQRHGAVASQVDAATGTTKSQRYQNFKSQRVSKRINKVNKKSNTTLQQRTNVVPPNLNAQSGTTQSQRQNYLKNRFNR